MLISGRIFSEGWMDISTGPQKKLSIIKAVNSNIGRLIANSNDEVPQAQNALNIFYPLQMNYF